jgi:hypothetical protein
MAAKLLADYEASKTAASHDRPTKASLQRELRAMTKRAEEAEQKLAPFLQWACKECGCSFGRQRKKKDDEGVEYCSACYTMNVIAAQRDVARATLARI